MAKQTYTTGQVLTAAQMTALQANDYNWTVSAKTASYVLVAADAGTRITMSNAGATTITVNTALFTAGDTLTITNIGAGACTITAGTATVSTAGSLVLNQYDSGTLYFSSTSAAIWNGANPGDITGITTGATSGLAGGVTSGTASLTLATAAKGDLLVGTGSNTAQVLTVGSNNQTLVADSSTATGLKWATASSGGMTVIASGSLSGTSVNLTSIPQTYKHLQLVMWNTTMSANDGWSIQYNGVTASNYARSSYGQNGATSVNGSVITDNGFYFGNGAADPLYTSGFNHWVLDIYDYTNTTGAISARGSGTYLNTSSVYSTYQAAYTYLATATAITSLNLKSGSSKTIAGSYILYGVN